MGKVIGVWMALTAWVSSSGKGRCRAAKALNIAWRFYLLADDEELVPASVLANGLSGLSDDRRVYTAAKTFIGGNRDEHSLADFERRLLLLEVGFVGEEVLNGADTKEAAIFKTSHILLHLGSSNHLHGLGDLPDRGDRLHTLLELLEVESGEGKLRDRRACAPKVDGGAL